MAEQDSKKSPKPSRVLPTARIAFAKQLEMLRAYGTAFVTDGRGATTVQIAELLGIHETTARLATPFFTDLGLLMRGEGGFTPNSDVIAFHRAKEWNQDRPERKLFPSFKDTWFAKALMTKVAFRGTLDESEAVAILADAAGASPDHRPQISILLGYLEAAGVIEREGTQLRAAKNVGPAVAESSAEVPTPSAAPAAPMAPSPRAGDSRTTEQHLLDLLDPEVMTDEEQSAVWALLKFVKKKNRS